MLWSEFSSGRGAGANGPELWGKRSGVSSDENLPISSGHIALPAAVSVISTCAQGEEGIGEILALRWGRVDLLHNVIAVEESYSGRFGPPKTPSSRRTVPISCALRGVFRLSRRDARALARPIWLSPRTREPRLAPRTCVTECLNRRGRHSAYHNSHGTLSDTRTLRG